MRLKGSALALGLLVACSSEPQITSETQTDSGTQMPKEEMMATLINLRGNLCAKVILISPEISPGEHQVNCEEYRDARKSGTKNNMVVYMVNLERGTVRLVGRG